MIGRGNASPHVKMERTSRVPQQINTPLVSSSPAPRLCEEGQQKCWAKPLRLFVRGRPRRGLGHRGWSGRDDDLLGLLDGPHFTDSSSSDPNQRLFSLVCLWNNRSVSSDLTFHWSGPERAKSTSILIAVDISCQHGLLMYVVVFSTDETSSCQ